MFHTYVTAKCGNQVDFDRAAFLMDRDLLDEALKKTVHLTDGRPSVVWGYYCAAHFQRYGEPFICDEDPYWDRPRKPTILKVWERGKPIPFITSTDRGRTGRP